MKIYLTSTETAFAKALQNEFLSRGDEVFVGEALKDLSSIDLFVATEDKKLENDTFTVDDGICPETVLESLRINMIAPVKALEAALPALDNGELKRVCFISSHKACVTVCEETSGYGYQMAKAALHQALHLTFNKLRQENYTMRIYDPLEGEVPVEASAYTAAEFFLRSRSYDPDNKINRNDENNFALYDAKNRHIPW